MVTIGKMMGEAKTPFSKSMALKAWLGSVVRVRIRVRVKARCSPWTLDA